MKNRLFLVLMFVVCTQEQIDSARPISTEAPNQPYNQSQIPTGYWASNPQAYWYQSGPAYTTVPPQKGNIINPASQHAYGAQPRYGLQQGYAGFRGHYSSFIPSYTPVVWPETRITEPNHAETASQEHGS